jgi:hypothetical protein
MAGIADGARGTMNVADATGTAAAAAAAEYWRSHVSATRCPVPVQLGATER